MKVTSRALHSDVKKTHLSGTARKVAQFGGLTVEQIAGGVYNAHLARGDIGRFTHPSALFSGSDPVGAGCACGPRDDDTRTTSPRGGSYEARALPPAQGLRRSGQSQGLRAARRSQR